MARQRVQGGLLHGVIGLPRELQLLLL